MGIRGLKTFMVKNVTNGVFKINIKNEINNYIRHNSTSPTIVFSVKGFIKCVFQNKLDLFFGGRPDQCYERIEMFLKTLHLLNVNMVFFYGAAIINKYNICKIESSLNRAYTQGLAVYDLLKRSKMSTGCLTPEMENNPILDHMQRTIYPLLVKYGYVVYTIEKNQDLELAAFARQKQVLAVIADDTDYLIYTGKWRYWSALELNPETFETNEYSRTALLAFIRLTPMQLCLFATCCGNDYCDYYKLKLAEKRIRLHYVLLHRMQCIANYVKQYKNPFNLTSDELKTITFDLFGECTKEGLNLVKTSISSYNYQSLSTSISVAENETILQNWKRFSYIYQIMAGRSVVLKDKYFDLRDNNSNGSLFNIVLPMYERKMGVLLWHKADEKRTVTVYAIKSHDEKCVANTITPVYPDKLKNICLDVKNHDIDVESNENNIHKDLNMHYKWDLLNWIVTECELKNINSIRSRIPDKYLINVLTLYYLVKQKELLSVYEADVILYTVQEAFEIGVPDEITYPETINKRAIIISHLFNQVYDFILSCYDVVRLEKFAHRLNFDGVFFHKSMIAFDNDAYLLKTLFEDEKLQTYRIYA